MSHSSQQRRTARPLNRFAILSAISWTSSDLLPIEALIHFVDRESKAFWHKLLGIINISAIKSTTLRYIPIFYEKTSLGSKCYKR